EVAGWQRRDQGFKGRAIGGIGKQLVPRLVNRVAILGPADEADGPSHVVQAAASFLHERLSSPERSLHLGLEVAGRFAGARVHASNYTGVEHVVDAYSKRDCRAPLGGIDLKDLAQRRGHQLLLLGEPE